MKANVSDLTGKKITLLIIALFYGRHTLGQQAGVLICVRAVFIRALWSAGSRWYFMASIR